MGWNAEKQSVDGSKNTWMIFLLMTVHLTSYILAKILIGTKRYASRKY